LSLVQAALLAGLPQAPSVYDPFHNERAALDRRDEVLRAMLSNRDITLAQYQRAVRSTSLDLRPGRIYTRIKQPYFFSYVIDELERQYGANTVREGGLKVYTTIDPRLQRLANKAIRDVLPYGSDPASAIVSVEPGTGAIRAMTAVVRNAGNQFNLAAQSARQAGSTFKPFVLASAIEQGVDPDSSYYTSAPFTCSRGPWCYSDYLRGKPWTVHTYGNTYSGSVSLTRATLSSDNTVYAQLTLDVGPRYVWQMAHRLGVHLSPDKAVASIGLGSLAVSPLDMAAAYATFAAMGIYAKPMAITKVVLPGSKVDRDSGWGKPQTKRALSQGVAWKVNDVLRQNALYGTGAGSSDGIHPNAGKTGTTENHADAWYDGYTRQLSSVVWMGYPKGEIPMLSVHGSEVAGATFDVPIWHEYMAAALWHHKVLDFLPPDRYPTWRSITRGSYGSLGSYYTRTYPSTTSAATTASPPTAATTSQSPPKPPPPKPTRGRRAAPTTTFTPPPTPAPPTTTETTTPAPGQ
jgi:penicillin-binding protein 1A